MGGSGGGSTTTVDKAYNAGMLELSQEQQGMATEMFNMYKYGVTYDPEEVVYGKTIDGEFVSSDNFKNDPNATQYMIENPEWTAWNKANENAIATGDQFANYDQATGKAKAEPERYIANQNVLEQKTRGEIEGYDASAQTSEMQYAQNLINSNQSLLGLQTATDKSNLELTQQQIDAQKLLLPQQTALKQSYLTDAATGLNVGDKMNQAQASVQHGFKLANEANRMDISSYGLDPSSGRYTGLRRDTAMAEATGIAGARTTAQSDTEAENFRRKGLALQV